MISDFFWYRRRRRPLALGFITRYHFQMSLLALRFKARGSRRVVATILSALAVFSLVLIALLPIIGVPRLSVPGALGIKTLPQLITSAFDTESQSYGNASKSLMRLSQLDRDEYISQSDYDTWAYSACSTTAMTEVFNAYGRHYRIADVLKVEADLGEITPAQGLMENVGIANTAARFGFQTIWGNDWTLDRVKIYANTGHPVIVGWPPSRYSGGHIVVITGGDADSVSLADSSLYDRHVISNAQFMQWWAGFAAVVMPA